MASTGITRLLCVLTLFLSSLDGVQLMADSAADLDRAKYLIAMIETKDNSGAGIVVGSNENELYIVTAYHVVKDEGVEAIFRTRPGEKFQATVIRHDVALDLAVLQISGTAEQTLPDRNIPFELIPPSTAEINPGYSVWSIGHGNGQMWDTTPQQSPDRIEQVFSERFTFKSSFVSPGYSGGGVFDIVGNKIMLVGMLVKDEPPNAEAIRFSRILEALRETAWNIPLSIPKAVPSYTLSEADKRTFDDLLSALDSETFSYSPDLAERASRDKNEFDYLKISDVAREAWPQFKNLKRQKGVMGAVTYLELPGYAISQVSAFNVSTNRIASIHYDIKLERDFTSLEAASTYAKAISIYAKTMRFNGEIGQGGTTETIFSDLKNPAKAVELTIISKSTSDGGSVSLYFLKKVEVYFPF